MQIGMIGLGLMDANMVRQLLHDGHECVVYDRQSDIVQAPAKEGAVASASLNEFVKLNPPRAIWLLMPAAVVDTTVNKLASHLTQDDLIIDGGNSYYIDDIHRAKDLDARGIGYVDVGTSGGVGGLERGYCMMIGGPGRAEKRLDPVFKTLAPGRGTIPRTPGREKAPGTAEEGYLHCGPSGS